MKIARLVQRNVRSCTIHDNLERAAQLMWDHDLGCLPVIDDHGLLTGIITDRDVCMAAYIQGAPLRAIAVTRVMTRQVYTCGEDAETTEVERTMRQHQVRRMPVIDDHGHLLGMVALSDLAREACAGNLPAGGVASTLAAVSARRVAGSAE